MCTYNFSSFFGENIHIIYQTSSFSIMAPPESVFNYKEQVGELNDFLRGHGFYPKSVSSLNN